MDQISSAKLQEQSTTKYEIQTPSEEEMKTLIFHELNKFRLKKLSLI